MFRFSSGLMEPRLTFVEVLLRDEILAIVELKKEGKYNPDQLTGPAALTLYGLINKVLISGFGVANLKRQKLYEGD